jgi:hypothetical protein
MNEIDLDWIQQFENTDELYKVFYKTNLLQIVIERVYVNTHKEIIYVKKEKINLENPNQLSKDKLIELIKSGSYLNNNLFKIFSIKYFNIDIDEEEVLNLLNLTQDTQDYNFLHNLPKLDNINLNQTITYFQKINRIYLFYISDKKNISNIRNETKKVYLHAHSLKKSNKTKKHIQL